MNRRSIFKLLASATLAAATEVMGLVPPSMGKVYRQVVNPDYVNAAFEDIYAFNPAIAALMPRSDKCAAANTGLPPRYDFVDGEWVERNPYKLEEVPV
jgi:hypothetical protein